MASVDDIFKHAGVGGKRKLDPVRDPSEIYKASRTSNGQSTRHAHAHVDEDEDVEAGPAPPGDDDDDMEAGPALPPDDDDGDDEEGRFFGGGVTAQENEILDYMNSVDDVAAPDNDKIDGAWLRKMALNFEKRISKNAQLRAKYESDPSRFIDSEADLDNEIKALSILGEHPELYPEFASMGCVGSLVGLLAHENTDIAIDAIECIGELTDEDVNATDDQWAALVDALLDADLLGLIASNFSRLDETQEADRDGVYKALAIIENLCSKPETADTLGKSDDLLKWLLARMQKAESPVSQNKQYAAEVLSILAQTAANRRRLAALDAVDAFLMRIAEYRRVDPKGGEEEEFVESVYSALTSIVDESVGKEKFVEAEGVELCLMIIKEGGKQGKMSSLRLLDHAANGGKDVCDKIVEAGGLKTLFTLFMKKHENQATEHLVSIFASLLRRLEGSSAPRIRALAKFVEKDYEKTAKLVKLRQGYASRLASAADDDLDLSSIFCLQTIDVVLAWLVAEDDGAKAKIRALLADQDQDFNTIKATIQEQLDGLEGEDDEPSAEDQDTKEMLSTLIEFLQ
ncbi:DUF1716-domain-containing protein [Thozetella sp. PMI_491]|nr:DUF1716-domain-containing protein [Thozetella sp. PMI_491]